MVVDMTNLSTIHDFLHALESGAHGDGLARYWADDAVTVTYPNAILPAGGTADRAAMLAASEAGSGRLAWQRYDIHDEHEHGDTAVLRLTWTGEVARDGGPFHAGQVLTAHVAQFIRVRDGRIAHVATYDCYEPFAV
jgi:ketosteroid isomerase-like protein